MDSTLLIVLKAIERIVIYAGAVFVIYTGYSLYKRGISKGRGDLKAKTKLGEILLSGTGPGVFFMVFGAIILLVGLFTGRAAIRPGARPDSNQQSNRQPLEALWAPLSQRAPADYYDIDPNHLRRWIEEAQAMLDSYSQQPDDPNNTAHEEQPQANQNDPNRHSRFSIKSAGASEQK